MAMIPSDQQSTFGPYSFCLTTSGAIQYGVPTIVARLFLVSVSFAQKPKSAGKTISGWLTKYVWGQEKHTDFDIPNTIKQDIITLDITMNDVLAM
jgi:hypothetical protein